MDLTALDGEVDGVVGDHRAEALDDTTRLKQRHRLRRGVDLRGYPVQGRAPMLSLFRRARRGRIGVQRPRSSKRRRARGKGQEQQRRCIQFPQGACRRGNGRRHFAGE